MPRLEDMFGLYTKMLLGMGLVFQMPTIVFFLAKMKLVTARFLLENGKYAILVIVHHRRGHHADRRSDEPDDLRRADDRALPPQHRHRVDREPAQQGRSATDDGSHRRKCHIDCDYGASRTIS